MDQIFNHTHCKVFACMGLAVFLTACQPTPTEPPSTSSHSFAAQQINLKMPVEPVPVEQRLTLTLSLPAHATPGLGIVEGESMYMGRIPLQWKQIDTGEWHADLYLGACTEPSMTWRLTVPLTSDLNDVPAQISLSFDSVAN